MKLRNLGRNEDPSIIKIQYWLNTQFAINAPVYVPKHEFVSKCTA